MTAPPANPAKTGNWTTSWRSAIALGAWAIYFLSLVIVYLVAFHRRSHVCEVAAGWGLATSFTAALLWSLARNTRRDPRAESGPARTESAGLPLLHITLLSAASLAVIWVAINLTLADQAAGAWALTLPATAVPVGALVGLLVGGPGRRSAPDVPPPTVPVRAATTVTQFQPEIRTLPDASTPHPGPVVAEPGSVVTALAPEVPAKAPAAPICLLEPDWVTRLGAGPPAVALDAGFWRAAVRELDPGSEEQGGVALVARSRDVVLVLGAVFPAQVYASSVRCEFSTADIERVRRALGGVSDELGIVAGTVKVTWVHTHPRLGAFLSGTDHETSSIWRQLDPEFTPIVIDISKKKLDDQIGVFDVHGNKIRPMREVGYVISNAATQRLRQEILRTYRDDGQAEPLVLMSGTAK
jgi:hypothetical protein